MQHVEIIAVFDHSELETLVELREWLGGKAGLDDPVIARHIVFQGYGAGHEDQARG